MQNNRILLITNHPTYVYTLRREIIINLINQGYYVAICCPYGKEIDFFTEMGCVFFPNSIDRHGKNIKNDLILKKEFGQVMDEFNPDIVLTYTIKPNIYGAMEARKRKIPQIANITGLGTAMETRGFLKKLLEMLYTYSFRKIDTIFFQNVENFETFKQLNISGEFMDILPGSGVNTEYFSYLNYPSQEPFKFVFISRVMKEKGIDDYLYLARKMKSKNQKTEFHVCGFIEQEYKDLLEELNKNGTIIYHGMVDDIREILKDMHCIIHPSRYPEGLSNVLLEAASSGRPIITTDNIGCGIVVSEQYNNGYIANTREQLVNTVEMFIKLSYEEKKQMGISSRQYVMENFNRKIVVNKYLKRIERIQHEKKSKFVCKKC